MVSALRNNDRVRNYSSQEKKKNSYERIDLLSGSCLNRTWLPEQKLLVEQISVFVTRFSTTRGAASNSQLSPHSHEAVSSRHPRWQAARKPYLTEVDFYHLVVLTTRIRHQVLLEFIRQRSYVWNKKEGRPEKMQQIRWKRERPEQLNIGSTSTSPGTSATDSLLVHARTEATSDAAPREHLHSNPPFYSLQPPNPLTSSPSLAQVFLHPFVVREDGCGSSNFSPHVTDRCHP